ncbi:X2-like carbohydrate binding domain-containing protein [Acididesulfobacillus acetoxydans]|nr:X2-like carbohydrate binding domain-containing protein [Acididesulfobacillus acetoxydans]
MRKSFRNLYSWLLIAVMALSMLVVQTPFAKPVYAAPNQNSTITPVTAAFDKNPANQADISVVMAVYGSETLTNIANGGILLTAGSDYSIAANGSTVTISKSYLAQQPIGTTTLTFNFSAGNPQTLQIVVSDTAPAYLKSLTKVLNYYKSQNYSNATSWWDMVGLWGAGDSTKTNWDSSKASLYGNILGSLAKGVNPSNFLAELKAKQDSSTGAFPGSYGPSSDDQSWAMVALDAGKTPYDQEKAVANLLTYQNLDGGFFYSKDYNTSDPDDTGMALLALANHQTTAGVTVAIQKAEAYLKKIQQATGGFASWGSDNPNSDATVISGLVAVGADPLSAGWQKNGKTMLDDLLSFQLSDGSFYSPYNPGKTDAMATYQSLIALGDLCAKKSVWQRLQESNPQENNSTIAPVTAAFDKNPANQADISVTMAVYGSESLTNIANGTTLLTEGSDYSIAANGSTVTISKSYLAQQPIGTTTLTFNFSAGNPQTLQIAVSDTTPAAGGGSSLPPIQNNITLSVTGKNGQVLLSPTTVPLESGDTAYSVLVRKLGQAQVTVSGSGSSIYVSGISGLKAGTDGPLSGWMFSVNGVYGSVSAAAAALKNGDVVAWRYTTNLGQDLGVPGYNNPGTGTGSATITPGTGGGTTTPVTSSGSNPSQPAKTNPVGSTESNSQRNQAALAVLNNVTAQQQAGASLPENTPAVNPAAAGQVVLRAVDGVQLRVPPGALNNQSAPVKFTVEIGKVTTPPQADTGAIVLDPLKYQRQFGIENSTGAVPEHSVQFKAPVIISFPVVSGDLPNGITTQQLAIYWWDTAKNDWVKLGGVFDPITKTISVPTYHLSTYAVMADSSSLPRRLAGTDRFLTADAVAAQGWKAGADNVVLVNAYAFPDALAAVPLAFKLNAPILLTEADTINPSTLAEIQKLKPKKITLIGGTAVISQAIQAEMEKTYGTDNVLRYGGPDRYSTAGLIAGALGTTGQAILANGDDYADALAVSSYAAYKGIPILFTKRTVLPDPTVQALAAQKVNSTLVVGGSSVVPAEITQRLPGVVRYGGSDRYATAAAIAQGLKLDTDQVYVVTGLDFADALTAGNLAAHSFSPVIMVDNTVPEATSGFLTAHKGAISDLVIVGGEGVISTDQENKIRALVPDLAQPQEGVISRQEVDETINGLVAWEKADIQRAFTQAAPGEIINPTVYNWPTVGLGRLNRYEGLPSYLAENEKYIAQDWNSVTQKVTDLARISLAVGAAGGDPRNFAGKDLIAEIANYPNVEAQGINGPIFALIALDSGDYNLPSNAPWTPDKLLKIILDKQLPDGGFSLDGTGASDPDITAMALQALAPFNTNSHPEVQVAVKKAVACLAALQDSKGGFKSGGIENSESISQVIIALSSLGMDIDTNPMFIKNNNSLLSALLQFRAADGGFKHLLTGNSDSTASEQALLALAAYERLKDGMSSLYDFRSGKTQTVPTSSVNVGD